MERIYDPKFHPSEGLDKCANILAFLQESMAGPMEINHEFSAEAACGLFSILSITETAIREISLPVGLADMKYFVVGTHDDQKQEAEISGMGGKRLGP